MNRRWGTVPAAGLVTRIQPLAFSNELLPVGTRLDGNGERPRGPRILAGTDARRRSYATVFCNLSHQD
jgi:hypothetical protein